MFQKAKTTIEAPTSNRMPLWEICILVILTTILVNILNSNLPAIMDHVAQFGRRLSLATSNSTPRAFGTYEAVSRKQAETSEALGELELEAIIACNMAYRQSLREGDQGDSDDLVVQEDGL